MRVVCVDGCSVFSYGLVVPRLAVFRNGTGLEPKRARVAQLQGVAGGEYVLYMGRGEQLEFIQCRGQAVDAWLAGLVLGNGLHVEFVISQNDERDATDGRDRKSVV